MEISTDNSISSESWWFNIYLETGCRFHYKIFLACVQKNTIIFLLARKLMEYKCFTNVHRTPSYPHAMPTPEEMSFGALQWLVQHKICHFLSTWNTLFLISLQCTCLFGNVSLPPYFNSWSDVPLFYSLPSDWRSQADLYYPSNITNS